MNSTLIKIVTGVYQPDGEAILVDGRETRFATPEDAKRAGVATICQELLLFPELTVACNGQEIGEDGAFGIVTSTFTTRTRRAGSRR